MNLTDISPSGTTRRMDAPEEDTNLVAIGNRPAREIYPLEAGVIRVTDESGYELEFTVGTDWPLYQRLPLSNYVTLNSETAIKTAIAW